LRARIDINEVETRTKIRAKYLRAMENDEWDLLPGEVYARSFLRTYGQFLGLDTRPLIDEFRRQHERPSDHESRPIATRGRDRQSGSRGPLVPPWLAIAGVLVAVVVALVLIGMGGKPGSTTSTQSLAIHHPQHRHHATGAHRRSQQHVMVRLQLVPTAAVYVCLVDGNGKRLIPGVIYNAGQTIPEKTASKMLLTLGNASVQMRVNGVTVPVAPSANPIGYELLPGSHHLLPSSAQPRCA
jgi:hypothetical protein